MQVAASSYEVVNRTAEITFSSAGLPGDFTGYVVNVTGTIATPISVPPFVTYESNGEYLVTNAVLPTTATSFSWSQPRGVTSEFRISWIRADGTIADDSDGHVTALQSAPDKIVPVLTSSNPDRGRHREFQWTAPDNNGPQTLYFVLRKMNRTDGTILWNYPIGCPNVTTELAGLGETVSNFPSLDTIGSCQQGWEPQCANQIDCAKDGIVNVTIGEDINQRTCHLDGSCSSNIVLCPTCTTPYLYPTETYDWKVIALNAKNGVDGDDGTCFSPAQETCDNNPALGTGWSAVLEEPQGVDTPDKVDTQPVLVTIGQTTANVTWTTPFDNHRGPTDPQPPVGALQTYRLVCGDRAGGVWTPPVSQDYLVPAWLAPTEVQFTTAPDLDLTFTGLLPGTMYSCTHSANNTVGGLDETVYFYGSNNATTDPDFPDTVAAGNISCSFAPDATNNLTGHHLPVTATPDPKVTVDWAAPRPNDYQYRATGPPMYTVFGTVGDTDGSDNVSCSCCGAGTCSAAQSHQLDGLYVYNTLYTFSLLAWSPTWYDTNPSARTPFQCTLPKSMPAAPAASVVNPYDHFAVVQWTAPVDNGEVVTQYAYQLCLTSDASCSSQNAPVRYMCGAAPTSQTTPCGTPAAVSTDFKLDTDGAGNPLDDVTGYTLYLRAENSLGLGWATTLTFTTIAEPNPAFFNNAVDNQARSVLVTWSAYAANVWGASTAVAGYRVTIHSKDDVRTQPANAAYQATATTGDLGVVTSTTLDNSQLAAGPPGPTSNGLVPGGDYNVTVEAFFNGYWFGPSPIFSFTNLGDVPETMAAPTVKDLNTNGLTVEYVAPFDNGYAITHYTATATPVSPPTAAVAYGAITVTANATSGVNQIEFANGVLVANVSYTLTVYATNANGDGLPSPAAEQDTCPSVPPAVGAAEVTGRTTTTVTFSWQNAVNAWTNGPPIGTDFTVSPPNGNNRWPWRHCFEVQYEDDCSDAPPGASDCGQSKCTNVEDPSQFSDTATDLRPGYPYAVNVRARNGIKRTEGSSCFTDDTQTTPFYNGNGNSGFTDSAIFYTLPTPPEAPNNLTLAAGQPAEGRELTLALPYPGGPFPYLQAPWANGAPISGYTIYSDTPTPSRTFVNNTLVGSTLYSSADTLGVKFNGLTPNTVYTFTVSANNSEGEGPQSEQFTWRTDFSVPERVTDFPAPTITGASINFRWSPPNNNGLNITKYRIYFRCQAPACTALSDLPTQAGGNAAALLSSGIVINSAVCNAGVPGALRVCGDEINYFFDGMQPQTGYEFAVQAFNGYRGPFSSFSGWSPDITESDWQTVTTTNPGGGGSGPSSPAYVVGLTLGAGANPYYTLAGTFRPGEEKLNASDPGSWAPDADSFVARLFDQSGLRNEQTITAVEGYTGVYNYSYTGAQPGTDYRLEVSSTCSPDCSTRQPSADTTNGSIAYHSTQPLIGAPNSPTVTVAPRVAPYTDDTTAITLNWDAVPPSGFNGQPVIGYRLRYQEYVASGPSPPATTVYIGNDGSILTADANAPADPLADCDGMYTGTHASPNAPATAATFSHTLSSLTPYTSYNVEVASCSEPHNGNDGSSAVQYCMCGAEGCPTPAGACPAYQAETTYTLGLARMGLDNRPEQQGGISFDATKTALYLEWELPFGPGTLSAAKLAGGLPILNISLEVSTWGVPEYTFYSNGCPSSCQDKVTLTDKLPFTSYPARIRVETALGWSDWSDYSYPVTSPDVPSTPIQPTCEGSSTLIKNAGGAPDTSLNVQAAAGGRPIATDNGLPLREVTIEFYTLDRTTKLCEKSINITYEQCPPSILGSAVGSCTQGAQATENVGFVCEGLDPKTNYTARTRARNALGWSANWSAFAGPDSLCQTDATPKKTDLTWLYILIGVLGGGLLCLIIALYLCWKYNLPKIWAPKLRRKREEDPQVEDFMSPDFMAMEDEDPELYVNPVLAAKMQMKKDRELANRRRGKGTGKSGGLKRLNLGAFGSFGQGQKKPQTAHQTRAGVMEFMGVQEGPKKTVREVALEKGVTDTRFKKQMKCIGGSHQGGMTGGAEAGVGASTISRTSAHPGSAKEKDRQSMKF